MTMNKAIFVIIFIGHNILCPAQVLERYPVYHTTCALRYEIIQIAQSQVGRTTNRIERKYTHSCDFKDVGSRSALLLSWCHEEVNVPHPASSAPEDWFKTNIVYRRDHVRTMPFRARTGEVVGLFCEYTQSIKPIGIIVKDLEHHYVVITHESGKYVKRIWRKENVYIIADYVGYEEIKSAIKHGLD